MDTPKTRFLNTLVSHLTTLAQMSDDMEELYKTYFDRGYNVAGAAQITDNDLTAAGLVGMTATDVSNIINLMEQLKNFYNNSAITPSDYKSILNRYRSDF